MWTEEFSALPRRPAGLSLSEPARVDEGPRAILERCLGAPEISSREDSALRAELASLRSETDDSFLAEALYAFATRQEQADRVPLALEVYHALAELEQGPLAGRARARVEALMGNGPAGARAEVLLRRLAREASDPAMLAAMGGAGLAFRATRLAVLSRLATSPAANFLTRGFGSRAVAGLVGFAVEAPVFTLTARVANEAIGRSQDWSSQALRRDLASSFLVLGAMKVTGWVGSSLHRRFVGEATPFASFSQSLFHQGSTLGGILLGHALEERAGLRSHQDGGTTLIDSLALLLQFHVAGRLSSGVFGENVGRWERDLDLRTETLNSESRAPFRPAILPTTALGINVAMSIAGEVPSDFSSASFPGSLPERLVRPMASETLSEAEPEVEDDEKVQGAEASFNRLLRGSDPIPEAEKRGLIARIKAGDRKAEDELLRSDLRYVNSMARRYRRLFDLDRQWVLELSQEGSMGLVKAAHRFDLNRENLFLTYATWWIRQSMTKYLSNNLSQIRIPAHRAAALRMLRQELNQLRASGKEAGLEEAAASLELSAEQTRELEAAARLQNPLSLDSPRGEDADFSLYDTVAAEGQSPDHGLVGSRFQAAIHRFVGSREKVSDRAILENRLFNESPMDDRRLAERLGMSRGELVKREAQLLRLLRGHMERLGLNRDGTGLLSGTSAAGVSLETSASEAPPEEQTSGITAVPAEVLRPRIAVIGFGMAGVGATNALRNFRLFSDDARGFQPQITVFEGMGRVGGKAAPNNMGAQFIDRTHFYPIDRLVQNLGLEPTALREDYDSAPFQLRSGELISGARFSRALRTLRQAARVALDEGKWERLDQQGAVDFIQRLGRANGPLDAEEVEAMIARLGFEEGTLNVSMLSYAINLAKSETPMQRYELVGGLSRIAEAEAEAVRSSGGQIHLRHPVHGLRLLDNGLQVFFSRDGIGVQENFDYGILALAPEHLRRLEVMGSEMPIAAVGRLTPAHIVKTNMRSTLPNPKTERATASYAMWFSPDLSRPNHRPMVTFFHGWNGEPMLGPSQMIGEAFGDKDPDAAVDIESHNWNGSLLDGIPHSYTTMPEPGRGYEMVRFAMDQYFKGRYDAERLRVANHVLGLGCYIRDAALSGEWAAISLLRGMGMDVSKAQGRYPRPQRDFLGMDDTP